MINGHTRIFGIIGYPVAHSLSCGMHNAAFKKLGINAAYVPFEVKPKELKNAVEGIRALGICGVNVTIPHKTAVIDYLDNVDQEAQLIGAVNTIVNKNGKLMGYNTDVYGFIKSVREDLRFNARGKNIFIKGAGGVGRAVAFSLAMAGARRIVLTDKIDEKSLELACEIELKTRCECIALKTNSPGIPEMILNSQLLVNATYVGMKDKDPIAINSEYLHEGSRVFDLVYSRETKLLRACHKAGIRAAGGLNMLLYQGAKAFELWTGKRAPVETMRKELC